MMSLSIISEIISCLPAASQSGGVISCALIGSKYKMEDSMELDEGDRHLISIDSVKVMAESIGISNINEDVCKRLTEEMEFRLKEVLMPSITIHLVLCI